MLSWSIFGFVLFVTKIYYTEAECRAPSFEDTSARLDFSDSFPTGFVLPYECRQGYYTDDDELSRTCLADGSWTDISGICLRKDCNLPDDLQNGDVSYDDTVFGSSATYTCRKGYILSPNPSIIYCSIISGTRDVAWNYGRNDRNRPNCRVVTCPQPVDPVNGDAAVQGSLDFGSKVLYTCDNDYVLSNSALNIGTCNENGTWGVAPTCIANYNCTFSQLSSFACGYALQGWTRVQPIGFDGIENPSAEADGDSTLTSPVFNSNEQRGCLSFYYRIASRTTNPFEVQLLYNNNERRTLFQRQQATTKWIRAELNIPENLGNVRWSFSISSVARRTLLLDEVQLSTSACAVLATTATPTESDSTATTNTVDTSTSPNPSPGLPLTTIIGIVIGVVVGIALIGLILYFIFKPSSSGKNVDSLATKEENIPLQENRTTKT